MKVKVKVKAVARSADDCESKWKNSSTLKKLNENKGQTQVQEVLQRLIESDAWQFAPRY